jgi:hypothetical protein
MRTTGLFELRLDLSALRLATFERAGKHVDAISRATKLPHGRRR